MQVAKIAALALTGLVGLAGPVAAQQQEPQVAVEMRRCMSGDLPGRDRLAACDAVLENDALNREGTALMLAYRGAAKTDLFDFSGGVDDLTQALALEPNNTGYLRGRARAFRQMEKYQRAIQDLDLALEIAPKFSDLYVDRAGNLADLGEYDAAFRDLDHAERLDPSNPEVDVIRAGLLIDRGRPDEAVEAYRKAADLRPDLPEIDVRLGFATFLSGDADTAIGLLDKAVAEGYDDPDAFLYRGLANHAADRDVEAEADFSNVIERDPTLALAWHRRGVIRMERKDFEDARADLDVAAQLSPSSDYLNTLAWLLVAADDPAVRDPEAALTYVDQSIALDENADNTDTAGAAYALLGNTEDAARYYFRAMELGGVERIRQYQQYLKQRGYFDGRVDGVDGPETRSAIRAFAKDKRVLLLD
ncbi:tetratricopeptide repeat protein [Rhodospirillaceae bacterium KN72]|uniref:Tetratricopeptide repeat protein n=1 Tax=Pacificispira spongiicola TaxID=2729598 RepID=A0A7Y0DYJ9_9PROT|nr:tetratricopeptide repeat protein [Pacificispira spongiicola]NMM43964.1 tetratricopeptide repeat protein [Pacificispira spongiicola]